MPRRGDSWTPFKSKKNILSSLCRSLYYDETASVTKERTIFGE